MKWLTHCANVASQNRLLPHPVVSMSDFVAHVCKTQPPQKVVERGHNDCTINNQIWTGSDHLRIIYQY